MRVTSSVLNMFQSVGLTCVGGVMLQVALTLMIACIVGLLAFSAYGSVTAALSFSILSALLWLYLIRL